MGKFDPQHHHRHSIRLKNYDYSRAGAYFVTAVTWQRSCLFGEIVDEEMKLNENGRIVHRWWTEIPAHFPGVETWAFVIMPNHIHGIIVITGRRGTVPVPDDDQSGGETPPRHAPTLGQVVAYFKYQSTKEMNASGGSDTILKIWQRNYYERIIRDEREMDRIWRYIVSNPARWAQDGENPLESG